ncbi:hypothetical protein N7478_001471 [Penicillium angulare]|uniref:uncharacterized protein n=1 Tax=Penicillium angulare TaxID=116970 RepID=UPI00253FCEEF|nr:uncharacterized protein N7478_001471 [Penicillium angulare]KAJ5292220.1 hypothetical protein N7478_001471 [Penicillium angulare]
MMENVSDIPNPEYLRDIALNSAIQPDADIIDVSAAEECITDGTKVYAEVTLEIGLQKNIIAIDKLDQRFWAEDLSS